MTAWFRFAGTPKFHKELCRSTPFWHEPAEPNRLNPSFPQICFQTHWGTASEKGAILINELSQNWHFRARSGLGPFLRFPGSHPKHWNYTYCCLSKYSLFFHLWNRLNSPSDVLQTITYIIQYIEFLHESICERRRNANVSDSPDATDKFRF